VTFRAKGRSPWFYLICRAKALCGKEAFWLYDFWFFSSKEKNKGIRGHSGAKPSV
jgi:hypothetical protein